jgi:hypothetical protein
MAIMNHFVAITAAFVYYEGDYSKVYDFIKSGYIVCGDDIVIFIRGVAREYERLMEALGVKINKTKSFESSLDGTYSRAEFCKKLAVNGNIVSGVSPKAIFKAGCDEGIALIPTALDCLQTINQGSLLRSYCVKGLASRYPKFLHHIPKEYGGLGFVNHVPKTSVLAKNAFVVIYHYMKLQSLLSYRLDTTYVDRRPRYTRGKRKGQVRDEFLKDKRPNSFAEQLDFAMDFERFHDYEVQPKFSDGKPHWRRLASKINLEGRPSDIQLARDVLAVLERWVKIPNAFSERTVDDEEFVVDNLRYIYDNIASSLFIGTPTKDDPETLEDLKRSKVALKLNKLVQRHYSGKSPLPILDNYDPDDPAVRRLVSALASSTA